MRTWRDKPLVVMHLRASTLRQPEHHAHAGAVYISIQHTHLGTFARQSQRQVDGRRGLTHATLARSDGDNIFHLGHCRHLALKLARGNLTTHLYMRRTNTFHILNCGLNHVANSAHDGASGVTQHQLCSHHTAVNIQLTQAATADQISFEVRVLVFGDGSLNSGTINLAHMLIRFTNE